MTGFDPRSLSLNNNHSVNCNTNTVLSVFYFAFTVPRFCDLYLPAGSEQFISSGQTCDAHHHFILLVALLLFHYPVLPLGVSSIGPVILFVCRIVFSNISLIQNVFYHYKYTYVSTFSMTLLKLLPLS